MPASRRPFQRTGRRHDLAAVHISDPREEILPAVGLLELEDAETGRRLLIDTSSVRSATAPAWKPARRGSEPCGKWPARRASI